MFELPAHVLQASLGDYVECDSETMFELPAHVLQASLGDYVE